MDSPATEDDLDALDHAEANRRLIDRHGTRVHDVIAQHQRQCDCPDAVRHLLATPALRVIEGGKSA